MEEVSREVQSKPEPQRTAMARLFVCEHRFQRLSSLPLDDPMAVHSVSAVIHDLCSALADAEHSGLGREQLLPCLAGVRLLCGQSPFVRRLQQWPRGYEGDFETIDYLLTGDNRAATGTLAYWIERFCLDSPMAQQHRNKVLAQAACMEACARRVGEGARILVLAAGAAPDVCLAGPVLRERGCTVVLNDFDAAALSLAMSRTQELGPCVRAVKGNVLTSINVLREHGPYDLVVAGGLFDYLSERRARFLVSQVGKRLLARQGRFFFTNIARPNPYRPLMEYMVSWTLIERSPDDVAALLSADGPPVALRIARDPTGLALLVALQSQD